MRLEEPIVLPSANRHGVSDEDALHAWAHAWFHDDLEDGMTMFTGPDTTGRELEVGVIEWHSITAIAHAMPARSHYSRYT